MKLWIEHAYQGQTETDAEACGEVVRTFQTEEQFFVILASSALDTGEAKAAQIADSAADMLQRGTPFDTVVKTLLSGLPKGERASFTILQVLYDSSGGCAAHLVECDQPLMFLIRDRQVATLPVSERTVRGRQVRTSHFALQDGDYAALVSQGYLDSEGWDWDWNDMAVAVRRLCAICYAPSELMGAMVRTFQRLNPGISYENASIVTVCVRPMQTATVWTGPASNPVLDEIALGKLMAERDTRIICGGTTSQIAARLMGTELELEPRPDDGWADVPPASLLEGVNLVTEGAVTLSQARERLAGDVSRGQDGATRLARLLLQADKIHIIVGTAINLDQASTAAEIPSRRTLIDNLVQELKMHHKIISVEYM